MKKNIYTIILSMLSILTLNAQQEHQYTQFMYNKLVFNPAFAGAREVSSLSAIYRRQWIGFEGAPTSQLIGFDAPLMKNRLGFGLNIHRFQVGINENYAANMSYSYSIIRTDALNLKLGIGGSFRHNKFDFSDPNFYIKQGNDPAVLAQNEQVNMNGNIGGGLYFTYKEFYVGVSAPNLYKNKIGNGAASITAENKPHYYAMAGGVFPMSSTIDFRPAMLFKLAQNAPFSGDANVSFMFNKKFTIGASYRFGQSSMADSFDFLLFLQASQKFGIGLAYDYNVSRLNDFNKGSFEALLRYDLTTPKNGKNNGDLTNPRYFF
jgi:type IX secretion system PorP/SprF family membrane protein